MESVDNKSYADVSEEEKEDKSSARGRTTKRMGEGRAQALVLLGGTPPAVGEAFHNRGGVAASPEPREHAHAHAQWRHASALGPRAPARRGLLCTRARTVGPATACNGRSLLARLHACCPSTPPVCIFALLASAISHASEAPSASEGRHRRQRADRPITGRRAAPPQEAVLVMSACIHPLARVSRFGYPLREILLAVNSLFRHTCRQAVPLWLTGWQSPHFSLRLFSSGTPPGSATAVTITLVQTSADTPLAPAVYPLSDFDSVGFGYLHL